MKCNEHLYSPQVAES